MILLCGFVITDSSSSDATHSCTRYRNLSATFVTSFAGIADVKEPSWYVGSTITIDFSVQAQIPGGCEGCQLTAFAFVSSPRFSRTATEDVSGGCQFGQ